VRVVSFAAADGPRLGIVDGDDVVDLSAVDPAAPRDLAEVLRAGRLPDLERLARGATPDARRPLGELRLRLPLPSPGKVFCLGLNYRDHIDESPFERQQYPTFFMRGATSLVASGEPIIRPAASVALDYEAELAVIIGVGGKDIAEAAALTHVAGYACFNDGSIRDYQRKSTQWTAGKNFDATGGFGPELVTPDELPAGAHGLRISSRLNGKVMQDGNTADMIFSVARTIAIVSEAMTLEPGDVIITGTPSGVGYARKPPVFMRAGDVCEVEIEGVGTLQNPIADA
jgi:2-keto-4-pentenoate hydratase/2-oxohepta-3-ene-1,7-dioic acid hydratase in catechol pathway